MSGQFARLQESLHRAHPTALNQRIEVFANDLNAILEHYVAVSTQSAHDTALLRQCLEALNKMYTPHQPKVDDFAIALAAIDALRQRLENVK